MLLLHGLSHNAGDKGIALIGDDARPVVVQLPFALFNMLVDVPDDLLRQLQLLPDLLVPFKELDGKPADELLIHVRLDGLLDVGDGVLHAALKDGGQLHAPSGLRGLDGKLRRLLGALALQGGGLDDRTAQGLT